ncbi:hypothetical protein ABZ330_32855 [Streptomyces sp. NPDC006172]|uniref:hypothetical protein n=1 Tax=Streptomyces sp. NPDC006172 TaxID=3154470 RepID=UPI0033FCF634
MNVTRNVKPRNLADSQACCSLAVLFWTCAALITFGPVLLLAVLSVAWAHPLMPAALMRVTLIQVALTAAAITPLYFASGVNRLAHSARLALLGPAAIAIALTVLLCAAPDL